MCAAFVVAAFSVSTHAAERAMKKAGVRGLLRPARAVGKPRQHPEDAGGRLIPVVERPPHGLPGQLETRAREGADGGLDVYECPPSVLR